MASFRQRHTSQTREMKTKYYYASSYTSIIQYGGFHLIEEAAEAVSNNREGNNIYARDRELMDIAFATLWAGPGLDAQKVVRLLEDPANRIKVLRGVAQVVNRSPSTHIWR